MTFENRPHNRDEGIFPYYTTWVDSHEAFINLSYHVSKFCNRTTPQHYSDGVFVIVKDDWHLVVKLWMTDLSTITTILQEYYDAKSPQPRDPASMLRCYLLFLITKPEIGITKWVNELVRVPYYAIISGFEPGVIPGVGTFYDFFKRLWAATGNYLKPKKRKGKRKPKKGNKG